MDTNPTEVMKARMQRLQDVLVALEMEGQSGDGLVKVTVNGKFDTRRVTIDPGLINPEGARMLEGLIVEALLDVKSKIEVALQTKMQEMTGGLR
jgi:DNA-binding YbaB/EbfC family protein